MISLEGIPFGLVGLAIAVLDFTGTSKKLEAVLRRYVAYERRYMIDAKDHILTTDIAYHRSAFLNFLTSASLMVALLIPIILIFGDPERLTMLSRWIPPWPWWSFIWWGPVVIAFWYALDHLTASALDYLISLCLWGPLWLLSKPKAGIVGTIGLVIAVLGSF